jgi:predicted metal-dependent hydrolase
VYHDSEEEALAADPRLGQAIALFNAGDWYGCHDSLEELWHETSGNMRPLLQGILQIAVAELHHERGNCRGATILMGEGLGRLKGVLAARALGLDLGNLRLTVAERLRALQEQRPLQELPKPWLRADSLPPCSVD